MSEKSDEINSVEDTKVKNNHEENSSQDENVKSGAENSQQQNLSDESPAKIDESNGKKKRGRPPKDPEANELRKSKPKVPGRKRGRPRKESDASTNDLKTNAEGKNSGLYLTH